MTKSYVYSTLTNDVAYTTWSKPSDPAILPEVVHQVVIKGGANVAGKHFVTPRGVATAVNDTDVEHLKNNLLFKEHEKKGFVVIETKKLDAEVVVAKGMQQRDDAAPHTTETMRGLAAKPLDEK